MHSSSRYIDCSRHVQHYIKQSTQSDCSCRRQDGCFVCRYPGVLSATILVAALNDGYSFLRNVTDISGLNSSTIPLIDLAYRWGNAQAYSTVFLSTLGFGGLALILCLFIGGVDESDSEYVATVIQNANQQAPVISDVEKIQRET